MTMKNILLGALALAAAAALIDGTYLGTRSCRHNYVWTGRNNGRSNQRYNPAPDAFYQIRMGRGIFR